MNDTQQHPEILYHYCSLDAFLGIIQGQSIWLSDYRMMNDHMEGQWASKKVNEHIKEYIEKDPKHLFDGVLKFFAGTKLSGLVGARGQGIVQSYAERFGRAIRIYLGCFSADDDSLSQWRAYAADGTGVAVGFNHQALRQELVHLKSKNPSNDLLRLSRVIYDDETQCKAIAKQIDQYLAKCPKNIENTEEIDSDILASLMVVSLVYKNDAFIEENEWRIIYVPDVQRKRRDDVGPIFTKLDYRAKGGFLVPNYTLEFPKAPVMRFIDRVVLGPKNQTPPDVIEEFMAANGFRGVDVVSSSASYR